MGHLTEIHHLTRQQASAQLTKPWPAYIGYIQQYDVDTGFCKVIDPSNKNPDTGTPYVSNWIPLATGFATQSNVTGNPLNSNVPACGIQLAPLGGASITQAEVGEQVLVIHLNPDIGAECAAFMMYNRQALPPGAQLPVTGGQLQNGEWIFVSPGGAVMHFDIAGNFNLYTQITPSSAAPLTGNIRAVAQGGISLLTGPPGTQPINPQAGDIDIAADANININGNTNINVSANNVINIASGVSVNITAPAVTIGSTGESAFALLTSQILTWLSTHTHAGVTAGVSSTGAPVLPPPNTYPAVTNVLFAG